MRRASLGSRMLMWLLAYITLATCALFLAVNWVHENAEHTVWQALLDTELDSVVSRMHVEPGYRWQDSDTMQLYRQVPGERWPAALDGAGPGLHDEVEIGDRRSAVLVRDDDRLGRMALALDITDFEALEQFVTRWSLIGGASLIMITVIVAWLGSYRLLRPLRRLADDIQRLRPEATRQRIDVDPKGSAELFVIADALNGYLTRHEQFVERERLFIDTASHELRTPIAVIVGATELALRQNGLSEAARIRVSRAFRTAREVEQLIALLLVLAKDPGRLERSSDRIALHELVPEIVEDHRHLLQGKALEVDIVDIEECEIVAPIGIVQAAIGNLLRNAIENSDQGTIFVRVDASATVTIEDPGHGMVPEEIARIYARLARATGRDGGGIGLNLVARLCEHLGWRLSLDSVPGRGTRAELGLASRAAGRPAPPRVPGHDGFRPELKPGS